VSKLSADGLARELTSVHVRVLTSRLPEEKKFPERSSRLPAFQKARLKLSGPHYNRWPHAARYSDGDKPTVCLNCRVNALWSE
jgi:hypothetical protein